MKHDYTKFNEYRMAHLTLLSAIAHLDATLNIGGNTAAFEARAILTALALIAEGNRNLHLHLAAI